MWACRLATEIEKIRDLIFRLALPYPHVSFHLLDRAKGKTIMFLRKVHIDGQASPRSAQAPGQLGNIVNISYSTHKIKFSLYANTQHDTVYGCLTRRILTSGLIPTIRRSCFQKESFNIHMMYSHPIEGAERAHDLGMIVILQLNPVHAKRFRRKLLTWLVMPIARRSNVAAPEAKCFQGFLNP